MYSYSRFLNVFVFCPQKNKSIWILGEVKLSQKQVHSHATGDRHPMCNALVYIALFARRTHIRPLLCTGL